MRLRSPGTLSTSETGTSSLTDAGPGRQLGLGTMHSTEEARRPVVLVGKGVCYDTGGECSLLHYLCAKMAECVCICLRTSTDSD